MKHFSCAVRSSLPGTSMAWTAPRAASWRTLSSSMSCALGTKKGRKDMGVSSTAKPSPYKPPKCAECAPLSMKIAAHPGPTAVLVSNYATYVWGDGTWINAKTQLRQLGLDPADSLHGPLKAASRMPAPNSHPPVIVLDIEGTTTPISFVTDVLFPYARDNVGKHLRATYESKETQDDIELLRQQVNQDLKECIPGAKPIPSQDAPTDDVIAVVEANVLAMINADRKITALKQLQGHIWRTGFTNGELQGQVFGDVPRALSQWQRAGTKTYIYSSGSVEAQRQIFGDTNHGNLASYLSGYFDTVTGNKREAQSYREIFLSVGVDDPSQITFATDVLAEAVAAKEAGLEAVILLRPGNAPLPNDHGFRTVESLLDI